jgi:HAD superfamily hydrolase (TIGR01544 family)
LRKLNVLISGGFDKLLVISDFDFTLSRFVDSEGKQCGSMHSVFSVATQQVNPQLYEQIEALKDKFIKIEFDPTLTIEEKIPHMEQWWTESHDFIVKHRFSKKVIEDALANSTVQLRDGAENFLRAVCERSVPLVLFSAGIGNLIEIFLQWKLGQIPPNLHIISNMMQFDDQDICTSFSSPLIHTFNKNSTVVGKERPYFHSISSRPYVLLLGDSLGDLHMDVAVEGEREILRVGFLNFNTSELYQKYYDSYDVVLLNDQTMTVPQQIFTHIHESIGAIKSCVSDSSNGKSAETQEVVDGQN